MREERPDRLGVIVAGAALLVIVALGVHLRLEEPLSSPALGAEDPYTHVVFTKEAQEKGYFGDSEYLGTGMYPPGMHAFMGIFSPLSGVSLYDFARFAPVVFGALAIFGTFALVARLAGNPAGLASALVVAVMPEHIFRTNLLFPTGLDLALLPAYLMLFDIARGDGEARWAAGATFLLATVAIAFTHPWAVPIFVVPALAYAALRAIREHPAREAARRMGLPAALATLATAFAMASRWDKSDSGFSGFLSMLGPLAALGELSFPVVVLFLALVAILGALALAGVGATVALAHARERIPSTARRAVAAGFLLAVFALAWVVTQRDLPRGVNYHHMLGPVTIALALVGLGLAFLAPSRAGDLGFALGALLVPLTAINVFDSPFWPQRTVAYLAIPVAILAGAAVGWTVERATGLFAQRRAQRFAAPVAILASVLLVGGAVATHPVKPYGWYRLYEDHEFAVLERMTDRLASEPGARIVVVSWQPAVVLRALGDPSDPRYGPDFYKDPAKRDKILHEGSGAKYVLVDAYVEERVEEGKANLDFLRSGYRLVDQNSEGTLFVYKWEGSS